MNWSSTENKDTASKAIEQSMSLLQRQVMEKCVPIVVLKLQESLPSVVENWIHEKLTDTNICEITQLYKTTLDGILKENQAVVQANLWEEFQSLCEKESNKTCKLPLENVLDVGQKLNQNLQKSFDTFGCFPDEAELEVIGATELENMIMNLEAAFVLPATKLLSNRLMKMYKEKNQSILTLYLHRAKKVGDSIKRSYLKEMESYIRMEPVMGQTAFQKMHSEVQEKALQVFDKSFNGTGKTITKMRENCKEELRQNLETEFRFHQVGNSERLSNWVTSREKDVRKFLAICKTDIQRFGKSTDRKLTGGTLQEICRISENLNKGMDLCNEFLLRVESESHCLIIDWLAFEAEFENIWVDIVFGEKLTPAKRREIVYKEMLNIHQEKMLEAVKTKNREHITALHKNLLAECVKGFENIVPYCQDQYTNEKLETKLNGIFNITIASMDYFSQYREKLEVLLRENNNTMESSTLLGHHNEIKSEVKKLLEIEGRKKLDDMSQEYVSQHVGQLENRIEEQFMKFQNQSAKETNPTAVNIQTLLLKRRLAALSASQTLTK